MLLNKLLLLNTIDRLMLMLMVHFVHLLHLQQLFDHFLHFHEQYDDYFLLMVFVQMMLHQYIDDRFHREIILNDELLIDYVKHN